MKRLLCLCLVFALLCPAALAEARPAWCRNYEEVIRLKCDPPRYLADIGDYWSLLDADGQVIEEKYVSSIGRFYEGLAVAYSPEEDDHLSSFINEAGEMITGFDFDNGNWVMPQNFSEGLCCVEFGENGLYGCINAEGEVVIEPRFEWLDNFSEGLARFEQEGKYGFINTDGEVVIEPVYGVATAFHDGRALVKAESGFGGYIDTYWTTRIMGNENGLYGYIDASGNMAIEPAFTYAGDFNDGLACVATADGKFGYIRPDGSFAIEPVYSDAKNFQSGYGVVYINPDASDEKYDLCGLIDTNGNVIIPLEYDWLYVQRGVNLAPEEIIVYGETEEEYGGEYRCFRFENGRAVEVNSIVQWVTPPKQEYDAPVIPLDATAKKPRLQYAEELEGLRNALIAAAGYTVSYWEGKVYATNGMKNYWDGSGLMLYPETAAVNYSSFYDDALPYHMLPIAKDALVFAVPEDSTIENLSMEQIKAIYSGEISDWSQLGAEELGKITAYQNYDTTWAEIEFENFMQDTWIMTPPLEFEEGDYGDYQDPCDFVTLPGAIGFEIKSMIDYDKTKGVKYLSIDGAAPTAENIANGSYPFAVNICAIYSVNETNPNVPILLDWLRSDEGRAMIENCGFAAW